MKIPEPINSITALIDAHHESQTETPRGHFGCSLAGHHCERWLWFSFRWAVREKFSGRMLRLFRRGQNEEETVVDDLRAIGCKVEAINPDGSQKRVVLAPHLSGSLDGVIEEGLPAAPNTRHVLEIKTHNAKSFKSLCADGVEKSKMQHFVQMQLYMNALGIDRALYYAVCKDDDSIYTERVNYDKEVALKYIERSKRIIASDRPPEGIIGNSTWYQCKWCAGHDLCYGSKLTKQVNCRTCAHSSAEDSGWKCARFSKNLDEKEQLKGCPSHVLHPDLVPWDMIGGDGVSAEFEGAGWNGERGRSSQEMINHANN